MSTPVLNVDSLTKLDYKSFCIDASDAGFPVGHFPRIIATDAGNQQPFLLSFLTSGAAYYRQQFGVTTLSVFND